MRSADWASVIELFERASFSSDPGSPDVWEKHWRFVARAREALRRAGHPVPEGVA